MCEARYRRRSHEWEYGTICPDCAGPKAQQSTRCRRCWTENVKRTEAYWDKRTCSQCGGPMHRQSVRCRSCATLAMVGRPGVSRVPGANHPFRRRIRQTIFAEGTA